MTPIFSPMCGVQCVDILYPLYSSYVHILLYKSDADIYQFRSVLSVKEQTKIRSKKEYIPNINVGMPLMESQWQEVENKCSAQNLGPHYAAGSTCRPFQLLGLFLVFVFSPQKVHFFGYKQ